jgi:anti-sigma-K factor RskA
MSPAGTHGAPHGAPHGAQAEVRAWHPLALARMVLVVVAAGAVLAGAPTALAAPLSLLALVVVAERLVRPRGARGSGALLVGAGGLLVTLILVGLLLGLSRIGLRPASWAISLAVVGLAGLALAEWRGAATARRRPAWLRIRSWFDVGWALASTAVVILALTIAVRATDRADVSPVQMSFGTITASSVQVVVSTDRPTAELELQTEAADGTSLSYPVFTVQRGTPVTNSIVLPQKGRFIITLNNPDQSAPLRTLILNR